MLDQLYFENSIMTQPSEARKRRLDFAGAKNFRDLGGYQTADGKTVRWNTLYRSDGLHKLTTSDLKFMSALALDRIIDFRADHERELEPDRLPIELKDRAVEIPILDSSTQIWHDSRDEFVKNLRKIDSAQYMIRTNMELATRFSAEMRQFVVELISANGKPLLFHCAAGKDRTGFAAAILLRMLGVPHEIVMEDYLLSNRYILPAHRPSLAVLNLLKGKAFTEAVKGFMEVRPEYLGAAFETIQREYGSFEDYVYKALDLTMHDTERLRALFLE